MDKWVYFSCLLLPSPIDPSNHDLHHGTLSLVFDCLDSQLSIDPGQPGTIPNNVYHCDDCAAFFHFVQFKPFIQTPDLRPFLPSQSFLVHPFLYFFLLPFSSRIYRLLLPRPHHRRTEVTDPFSPLFARVQYDLNQTGTNAAQDVENASSFSYLSSSA